MTIAIFKGAYGGEEAARITSTTIRGVTIWRAHFPGYRAIQFGTKEATIVKAMRHHAFIRIEEAA